MAQDATAFFRRAMPGLPSHFFMNDLSYAYYSNYSGLTPKEKFSHSDHQYAFYCSVLGYTREYALPRFSMGALEYQYYVSLGIDMSQGINGAEDIWLRGGPRVNLCVNPKPTNIGSWAAGTALTVVVPSWGGSAIQSTATGAGTMYTFSAVTEYSFSSGDVVSASAKVEFSFEITHYKIALHKRVGNTYYSSSNFLPIPAPGTTISVSATLPEPVNTLNLDLSILCYSSVTGTVAPINSTINIGNVLIEKAVTIGAYFDGDSLGAVWNSTPGSSSSTLLTNPAGTLPVWAAGN